MREILKKFYPFLVMPIITPFYIFLDKLFLVDILGCGCVPGAQTNRLNISLNANDFRLIVYGLITIFMVLLGIRISREFRNKWIRTLYCVSIFIVNSAMALYVNKLLMWG